MQPRGLAARGRPRAFIEHREPCRLAWRSAAQRQCLLQPRAAHIQGPSADLAPGQQSSAPSGRGPSPTPPTGTPPGPTSVLSYLSSTLGLSGRFSGDAGSDSLDSFDLRGGSGAAAVFAGALPGGAAGQALLGRLRGVLDSLGSSLEQLAYDSAAESMPAWDASQACGVLMALGALGRRPDDPWLTEFWAVSLARLHEASAGDLAMLSYGLSELRLQPPQAWVEGLKVATMALADGTAEELGWGMLGSALGSGAGAGAGAGSVGGSAGSSEQDQQAAFVPPPPVNSAYDMEENGAPYAGGVRSSSGIANAFLGPAATLWQGLRAATSGASAAWRRRRAGGELVTVVYNMTAAGLALEVEWLEGFLEAMAPRLVDLSADDLSCLLAAAEAAGEPGRGWRPVAPSRAWQAALFARMDGVNWALQARHHVGCLSAVTALGLQPPPPWVRRQLTTLQPSLASLPGATLVDLAALLPVLPLPPPPGPLTAFAGAAPSAANAAPVPPSPSLALERVDDGPSDPTGRRWLDRWLSDFRTSILDKSQDLDASQLLRVITSVAAVAGPAPPPEAPSRAAVAAAAAAAAAQPLGSVSWSAAAAAAAAAAAEAVAAPALNTGLIGMRPPAAGLSYGGWRQAMAAAVAERLPEAGLTGLCEAWAVLADADAAAGPGSRVAVVSDLRQLRAMVVNGIATFRGPMSPADVAPVLSSLAAAGQPLPGPCLEALLGASEPHLRALGGAELVTVALSLVRLSHRPSPRWQAAFFSATRRRLPGLTPGQRCSLVASSASLGLALPGPWLADFYALSEPTLDAGGLDGGQLSNLLWAVSCAAPPPPDAWLQRWEMAALPKLRELPPSVLALVLKAMSSLQYRPSAAWQSAYFAALQRRLFAAGAAQLTWPQAETGTDSDDTMTEVRTASIGMDASPAAAATAAAASATAAAASAIAPPPSLSALPPRPTASPSNPTPSTAPAPASASAPAPPPDTASLISAAVTPGVLNSIVYSLAALDLAPPPALLQELLDAIRCKLSMLSSLDMSVVLAYLVARGARPSDEWWEVFLEAMESKFEALAPPELTSALIMLNALKVSPSAEWLDCFCAATEGRLATFQPPQLLQVLSCLHLFRHRPGQSWLAAYSRAAECCLDGFSPTELARLLMLLDHLHQRPTQEFMAAFFSHSRPALKMLDTQELVNVSWAVVNCSVMQPDTEWVEALVAAARPRVASLSPLQLKVLVASVGQMQRGATSPAAAGFLAFAKEFLVV
ncbi:hypothetical protein HYH03_014436 [Edaphochlamys debaryana]|uniref:Uncharacterized protein n=1 Tax=Edaphochlamys debaryana TaxID=47281 RepID=A0A835XP37_9CHLO|nr:hypothetical protein HYH03_014436 [Edaphochlamys debaryana]|eukprot:KAG2486937.1 hypothetical protein HYH03_014436 [Edaphochlamys debaryana]